MNTKLTEKQLSYVLEPANTPFAVTEYVGKTLEEYIKAKHLQDASPHVIYDVLTGDGLKTPFRTAKIYISVQSTQEFDIIVPDDKVDDLEKMSSSDIFELDPDFSFDDACDQTVEHPADSTVDFAIYNDDGDMIFDFD